MIASSSGAGAQLVGTKISPWELRKTSSIPHMGDNAEESDRQLAQFLGTMRHICIEKQGIPRCERVNLVPVPVSDLTF
jgi:hypothetical protein